MFLRCMFYFTICYAFVCMAYMHAEEIDHTHVVPHEATSTNSFVRGMTIAPFIQIPWLVVWGLGQAKTNHPGTTMRNIFLEFVEGTDDNDVLTGMGGLLTQQVALTLLIQAIGTYRHNKVLQNPVNAWFLINCALSIFKLFRVTNNLTELNRMIDGIKKLHLYDLIAFQKAKSKGLHGFIFR